MVPLKYQANTEPWENWTMPKMTMPDSKTVIVFLSPCNYSKMYRKNRDAKWHLSATHTNNLPTDLTTIHLHHRLRHCFLLAEVSATLNL